MIYEVYCSVGHTAYLPGIDTADWEEMICQMSGEQDFDVYRKTR